MSFSYLLSKGKRRDQNTCHFNEFLERRKETFPKEIFSFHHFFYFFYFFYLRNVFHSPILLHINHYYTIHWQNRIQVNSLEHFFSLVFGELVNLTRIETSILKESSKCISPLIYWISNFLSPWHMKGRYIFEAIIMLISISLEAFTGSIIFWHDLKKRKMNIFSLL